MELTEYFNDDDISLLNTQLNKQNLFVEIENTFKEYCCMLASEFGMNKIAKPEDYGDLKQTGTNNEALIYVYSYITKLKELSNNDTNLQLAILTFALVNKHLHFTLKTYMYQEYKGYTKSEFIRLWKDRLNDLSNRDKDIEFHRRFNENICLESGYNKGEIFNPMKEYYDEYIKPKLYKDIY